MLGNEDLKEWSIFVLGLMKKWIVMVKSGWQCKYGVMIMDLWSLSKASLSRLLSMSLCLRDMVFLSSGYRGCTS